MEDNKKENLENIYNNNSCKGFLNILNEFIIKNYKKFYITMGNGKNKKKIEKRLYSIFTKAFIFIAIIFLIEILFVLGFLIFEKEHNPQSILDLLGPFGDFFGGMLNPILTFCTFMALLMTIILQQRELKLSREQVAISVKELGETRKATEISSQALTEQSNSLKIQNFENTFFKMIDLHNNISYKLDGKTTFRPTAHQYNHIGRYTPLIICFEYQNSFYDISEKLLNQVDKELILDYIFAALNPCLGHYFRNIYQILKFIDSSDFIKNKKFYSNILRAQLNQDEQRILFFNCISKNGINMLSLVTKYEFLEHLNYHTEFKDNFLKLYIQESKKLDKNNNHKAFGNNDDFIKACKKNNTK